MSLKHKTKKQKDYKIESFRRVAKRLRDCYCLLLTPEQSQTSFSNSRATSLAISDAKLKGYH